MIILIPINSNSLKVKTDYVYYDHYRVVPREDFVEIFTKMKRESCGAILRKKICGPAKLVPYKIVTTIFDDVTEAHDEMCYEIGSVLENNTSIGSVNLVLNKYQACVDTSSIKRPKTEYQIYSLN